MATKKKLIPKVTSIMDLLHRAATDPRYAQLACLAADNLGGDVKGDLRKCYNVFCDNATAGDGCSEEGVVDEINFCRDLVK